MTKKLDEATYLREANDLAEAVVDYLREQVNTHHSDIEARQSIALAGTAAIAAGLSMLIGGARVNRKALASMINKQMERGYEAIKQMPGSDDMVH